MKISYYDTVRSLINNYEQFRIIALNLNRVPIDTEYIHESYEPEKVWSIHKIHFPNGYVAEHTGEAIVQSLFKVMADNEEWEEDFWEKTPYDERLSLLDNSKQLFCEYICYETLRFSKLSFQDFLDEIHSWGLCDERAEQLICQFSEAEIIALGGNDYYAPDENWIVIQDNAIMFLEFFCAD